MEVLVAHFRDYALYYGISLVVLVPLLYATRKYSLPIIFYTLETVIYLGLMHIAVWLLVTVTRWFAENSSMRALREDGRPLDAPEWGTPLLEFWRREAYDPQWLVYVEIVAILLIILLVWKFRPLRIKYKGKRRQFANEGKPGARGASPNWRDYSKGGPAAPRK